MLIIKTFKRSLLLFFFYVTYSYIHLYINCLVMSAQVTVTRMRHFLYPMPEVSVRARGPLMPTVSPSSCFYLFRVSMPSGESDSYHLCLSELGPVFQLPQHVRPGFFNSWHMTRDLSHSSSPLAPFRTTEVGEWR